MTEIVERMTDSELERETQLIAQINEGRGYSLRAWDLIAPAMAEVYELKLYRREGTMEEWAERNFGFSARTLDYYLINGKVRKRLQEKDPDFPEEGFGVTYSNLIDKYEEEDQADLWFAAKKQAEEGGVRMTGELIKKVARHLEQSGEIHLREGVNSPKLKDEARTIATVKRTWFEIEEAQRAEVFRYIVANEDTYFLEAMERLIKERIQHELNAQRDDDSE